MTVVKRRLVMLVCAALALTPSPGGRAAADEGDAVARAHSLAGIHYYDQANYADALREFGEAYRLSKRPALVLSF